MPTGYNGLLNAAAGPDQFPDTNKPAADLFTEFGILTPSEKAAETQKQQMALQLFAQQQELARKQQAIQAAQLGQGYGFSTLLALGGTRNQAPQGLLGGSPPGAPQQQGPDVASLLAQESQAAGGDPIQGAKRAGAKLLQMGTQTQNPDLAKIGLQMIIKAREKELKQQQSEANVAQTQASTEETQIKTADTMRKAQNEQAALGNPGTPFQGHAPNGDMVSMAPTYDKAGVFTGYRVITSGPNKQIVQTSEDPRTATQRGEEYGNFQKLLTNSAVAIDSMGQITKGLEEGAAQGWAGTAVTFLDNAAGTLGQLAPGASLTSGATKALEDLRTGDAKTWFQKTGVNESRWVDLVSNLAKTYNPTGTITEKDISRAAGAVGANYSNPATVADILKDAKRRVITQVDKTYEYMGEDARKASTDQYQRFRKNTGQKKAVRSGTVTSGPNKGKRVTEYDDGTRDFE